MGCEPGCWCCGGSLRLLVVAAGVVLLLQQLLSLLCELQLLRLQPLLYCRFCSLFPLWCMCLHPIP